MRINEGSKNIFYCDAGESISNKTSFVQASVSIKALCSLIWRVDNENSFAHCN